MSKKYSQVRTENPAATLTGAEIFVITQGGESVGTTVQEVANFAGGGGLSVASADTTGATITIDFDESYQRIFFGSASFATPKTIALSNDTNAVKLDFSLNITNVAGVLTFPAEFVMSDVRWDTATQEWTPDQTGIFKGSAFYDGTNWILDISQSPYA